MDNEELVLNWRAGIIQKAAAKLERKLSEPEMDYINSLGSFMGLEYLEDKVDYADPEEIESYLVEAISAHGKE